MELISLSSIIDEFEGFAFEKTMRNLRDILDFSYKINVRFNGIETDEETQKITLLINLNFPNGIWVRAEAEGAHFSKERVQFKFVLDCDSLVIKVNTDSNTYRFIFLEQTIPICDLVKRNLHNIRTLTELCRDESKSISYNYKIDGVRPILRFFNSKYLSEG